MPPLGVYAGYASFLIQAPTPPSSINDWVNIAFNLSAAALTLVLCAVNGSRIQALREGNRISRAIEAAVTSRWTILFILFAGLTFCLSAGAHAHWILTLHRNGMPSVIIALALFLLRVRSHKRTYEDIALAPKRTA